MKKNSFAWLDNQKLLAIATVLLVGGSVDFKLSTQRTVCVLLSVLLLARLVYLNVKEGKKANVIGYGLGIVLVVGFFLWDLLH